MKDFEEIVYNIESEMVSMWLTGEAPSVLEKDPDFVKLIMIAVFHEREHFQRMGLIVGEA
tara:strand:+ start:188 stop:367 length:180 start_codon:yes stop_codon:yes gene_type:complete